MKHTEAPVIVEQYFSLPKETVWEAITVHEQMIKWYFDNIPEFETKLGFKTEFVVESGDRKFTHLWEIIEINPMNKIVYTWNFSEYPGFGHVAFELFEKDGGTLLRLTNVVTEDFPDEIPEFKRESCLGGWEYFINGNLKSFLDS